MRAIRVANCKQKMTLLLAGRLVSSNGYTPTCTSQGWSNPFGIRRSRQSCLSSQAAPVDLPYPRGAVAVTIQSKGVSETGRSKNCYLLVQRANPPDQGKWSLPGGKIAVGEATLDAAFRELTEETQLVAEDCRWYPYPFMATDAIFASPKTSSDALDAPNYAFHYLIAQCFGRAPDGLPTLVPSDDALDAKWWTLADIEDMLVPEDKVSTSVVNVISRAEELCLKGAMDDL